MAKAGCRRTEVAVRMIVATLFAVTVAATAQLLAQTGCVADCSP